MRTQDQFVAARKRDWRELEVLLAPGEPLHRLSPAGISRAATLYRDLCADLMRARTAAYSLDLVAFLDALAGRAHGLLYTAPPYRLSTLLDFFRRDFPRTLRRSAAFFFVAAALFLVPGAIGFTGAYTSRTFATHVLPEEVATAMEESYAKGFDDGRGTGSDTQMAGFYVHNNVGIAFRCFATGILCGLGSAFFLFYNGLFIGVVMGLVARAGHGRNLFTFVCGHSAFELTAIIIAGAAGLQMGYALVATGGRTRLGSLRAQARDIAHLVLGAAAMLLIAAAIEGFWSPSSAPPPVKWTVAGLLTSLVTLYLLRAGRQARVTLRS